MKPSVRWFGVLAVFLAIATAARAADVVLMADGIAKAAICVSPRVMAANDPAFNTEPPPSPAAMPEFQRQQLREAVKDLVCYLTKMSGGMFPIATNAVIPAGLLPVYIGELAAEKFGAPGKSAPFQQGFRVVVSSKGLGLLGESDLATSYAIYELLDRLGCRWFMPTELGECIPETKTIALAEMDFSSAPATIYRGIWQADQDFKRRNRLGGMPLQASHALGSYLDQKLLDQHPDWVAVYQGKPIPPLTKWTRPEIADAMADKIIGYFDTGVYKWSASLSPEDGMAFDESEDPKFDAGDFDPLCGTNSITDRLILLCNRIAAKVTKKYPDALFGVCAYVNYTRPPVREKLHPSIVPVIAPITYSRAHPVTDEGEPNNRVLRSLIEGWGKAARMTGVYYYGWFLAEYTAPYPMIAKWGVDVPFAIKNGSRFFQPETDCNFETTMHGLYLGMRLAFDPGLDPKAIVADLNTRFYGHSAEAMAKYWGYVDGVWVNTPEYSGAAFGYARRFPPAVVKQMRALLDAGIKAAQTPTEKARIALADASLKQFELYMQMRYDLNDGRFTNLGTDAARWIAKEHALADQYRPQYAFTCRMYGAQPLRGSNNGVDCFNGFHHATYDDATRIVRGFEILTPAPLREWRFAPDKEKQAQALGWLKPEFDDKAWKTTDVAIDTWSALGLHNYYGSACYRREVSLPACPTGRKIFLWLAGTDGDTRLFVNGKPVPYVDAKGGKTDQVSSFSQPLSFDVTDAVKPGTSNQVTILCTRTALNEVGTGGLMGPVVIYRERN